MSASVEDIVGAALAAMDRLVEAATGGHIAPVTLTDRLHTHRRAIAAAGIVVPDDSLAAALDKLRKGLAPTGGTGQLAAGFAEYRKAVHERIDRGGVRETLERRDAALPDEANEV